MYLVHQLSFPKFFFPRCDEFLAHFQVTVYKNNFYQSLRITRNQPFYSGEDIMFKRRKLIHLEFHWCLYEGLELSNKGIVGGAVVSWLECAPLPRERFGFEPWPETLCCVLGQDTSLLQCLSPPRCVNGYRRILMLGAWGQG